MSGVELKYVHLHEDDYLSRPEPGESCLGGSDVTSAWQPAGPTPIVARSEIGHPHRSSAVRISALGSDSGGNGSASTGGIAPEYLDVSTFFCTCVYKYARLRHFDVVESNNGYF